MRQVYSIRRVRQTPVDKYNNMLTEYVVIIKDNGRITPYLFRGSSLLGSVFEQINSTFPDVIDDNVHVLT